MVVSNGQVSVSATPIVAGAMTLINEGRLKAGKSPIGFWNPALYEMNEKCPQCFNRVKSGNNKCTHGDCCEYGYYVPSDGSFNAVTGLGTLNVKEAIKFMVSL